MIKKINIKNIDLKKVLKLMLFFLFGFFIASIFGVKICFFTPIVFAFISIFTFIFRKKIKFTDFSFLSIVAFFGAVWFCFNIFFSFNFAKQFDGKEINVVGTIKDVEYLESGNILYILKVKKIGGKRALVPFNVKLYLNSNEELECNYFDEVKSKLKLKFCVQDTWFKFFDFNFSKKNFFSGRAISDIYVKEKNSFFAKFLNLRDSMMENIDFYLEEPYNFLVYGIVFGRTKEIPFSIKRVINRCGLSHIFAISGLHISILSICIIFILRLFRAPGKFSFIFLFFFMFIYSFIVGFSPSVLRASIMAFCVSFAILFKKKIKPFSALSIAAFVIVLVWPFSVFSLSFVLSFASCLGIIFLRKIILRFILLKFKIHNRFIILVLEGFCVSLSATISTSIFIMFNFEKISIIGPFVNFFVLPFLPVLYILSISICFFGFFSETISSFLGYLCEGIFGSIFYCLDKVSKNLFCYIPTNYFFVKFIIISIYLFFAVYFIFSRKFIINKKFIWVCFLFLITPPTLSYIFKRGMTRIYLVGNGYSSSVVIRGQGKTVVINCDGVHSSRKLVDFLDSKGIGKVDFLVLASLKKKNILGAVEFLKEVSPTCVVLSEQVQNSNILDYIDSQKTNVILNRKFYLEYLPISINVINKGKNFGFYLNMEGACFGYAQDLDFMYEMSRKKHINFAILDKKVKDLDRLKQLNVENCLGLLNGDFSDDFFKSANNKEIAEFIVLKHSLKRGEI